jgi:GH24 family phage-related lysozyme (muramidase)
MRDAVRAAFPSFTDRFEGCLGYMYTDVEGLVTTGRGNLIDFGKPRAHTGDPIVGSLPTSAMLLPFQLDGVPVDRATIATEFQTVKNAWPGVQSVACKNITKLRLTQEAIDELTNNKLASLWHQLLDRFPGAEDWCADAQLGLCSMAWAMGAAFYFPHFLLAANTGDWMVAAGPPGDANTVLTARGQAWMKDGTPGQLHANVNPGLRPRNLANKILFSNAALSTDPDTLFYPQAL